MLPEGRYRVVYPDVVRNQLAAFLKHAISVGHGQLVREKAAEIVQELMHRAREFGDPCYRLPAAKLQVRMGVRHPLSVIFGVHEEQDVVFVSRFNLLKLPTST